jgi:hypothetical protein
LVVFEHVVKQALAPYFESASCGRTCRLGHAERLWRRRFYGKLGHVIDASCAYYFWHFWHF